MTGKQRGEAAAYAAAHRPPADDGDDAEVTATRGPEQASAPGGADSATPPGGPGGSGAPREPEDERDVERDLYELAAKAEKADEYLVLAQRTKADFENYRKRASREAALAQERGVARLAKELLPAIDNLDRAVQAAGTAGADAADSGNGADSQLVSGIKLVQADLTAALARAGIESFTPVGEAFDPHLHEAVAQIPVEGSEPGTVVEVYQPGYRLGETVLRAARVLVAA
jgi:molecular chaperone GrpE